MRILIVVAHPEKTSFNASLADKSRQIWVEQGHETTVVDLYSENFDPREGDWHYAHRQDVSKFDPMQEQRHHWLLNKLPCDITRHVDLLLRADVLILHFPFWWFGAPAILKGWMDRVFIYGGLYQSGKRYQNGVMRGKKALLVSTAGSSAQACAPNGRDGNMRLMLWPLLYSLHYVGFDVLEPYLIYGVRGGLIVDQADQQQRELASQTLDYQIKLRLWKEWPSIQFNHDEDFSDAQVLKSDAPVYSPFIRHNGLV